MSFAQASLDLQPSWKLYVEQFGYEFQQWDMHESGEKAILGEERLSKICDPVLVMGMYVRPWQLLSPAEQAAAAQLGWTNATAWNGGAMPRITVRYNLFIVRHSYM